MTKKEVELLDIAKEVCGLNINIALTGFLMLALRGIDKPREAGDIDFIITDTNKPVMPSGFEVIYDSSTQLSFRNKNGIVCEFFKTQEPIEFVKDIPCCTFDNWLKAKRKYIKEVMDGDTSKHGRDLTCMGYTYEVTRFKSPFLN